MIFKSNKENSKSERTWVIRQFPPTIESKYRNLDVPGLCNLTLHGNRKIAKVRRNSNLTFSNNTHNPNLSVYQAKSTELPELEGIGLDPVLAKRISLYDNREKGKNLGKNTRSVSHHCQRSALQESNFDLLKQEARKLEDEESFFAQYRWKPTSPYPEKVQPTEEEAKILDQIKKSKKSNMRKIIKGRPEIKRLLQENRQRLLKQRTLDVDPQDYIQTQHMQPKIKLNLRSWNGNPGYGTPQCQSKKYRYRDSDDRIGVGEEFLVTD